MTDKAATVALVDDHAMVREALSSVLSATGSVEVVAQGEDTQEALRIVREHAPDVAPLLVDQYDFLRILDVPKRVVEAGAVRCREHDEDDAAVLTR